MTNGQSNVINKIDKRNEKSFRKTMFCTVWQANNHIYISIKFDKRTAIDTYHYKSVQFDKRTAIYTSLYSLTNGQSWYIHIITKLCKVSYGQPYIHIMISFEQYIPVSFLFVCLFGGVPHEKFHWLLMKSYTFGLFSALMAIEQWGFFSVPHLLWHKTSVYNGHLRGPVTLTPVAERLAVELF